MSQQEFETYLALLTRLLKVPPAQREDLAEEFRAHLEDRLEELLASGMEQDQAVRQAVGEFGDAAVLAAGPNGRRGDVTCGTVAFVAPLSLC